MLANSLQALENPLVASSLGLALAAGVFAVARMSSRLLQPERMSRGMALYSLSLFGRLLAATLALWSYKTYAPAGITPFALMFAGGFLVLYTYELVRFAGLRRYRRPAAIRH